MKYLIILLLYFYYQTCVSRMQEFVVLYYFLSIFYLYTLSCCCSLISTVEVQLEHKIKRKAKVACVLWCCSAVCVLCLRSSLQNGAELRTPLLIGAASIATLTFTSPNTISCQIIHHLTLQDYITVYIRNICNENRKMETIICLLSNETSCSSAPSKCIVRFCHGIKIVELQLWQNVLNPSRFRTLLPFVFAFKVNY